MQFVGISNMEFDMISYNGQNVIRFVSSISVGGFLWFTFFAPETLNAAQKANYCLFGFLAATALYYYIKYTNEIRLQDSDNTHRQTDTLEDDINRRLSNVQDDIDRRVDRIEERIASCCAESGCSTKKTR